eukprot:259003_1
MLSIVFAALIVSSFCINNVDDNNRLISIETSRRELLESSSEKALHRYYDIIIVANGDHFYTTNYNELGNGKSGYVSEGVACFVYENQVCKSSPLYRYYNSGNGNGDHLYTTNYDELSAGGSGYVYEGIQGYCHQYQQQGTTALYRYYNSGNGDHFYTTNYNELGNGKSGYVSEGVACFVYENQV